MHIDDFADEENFIMLRVLNSDIIHLLVPGTMHKAHHVSFPLASLACSMTRWHSTSF